MKKIYFNDNLGLTQAVLDGRKTMTRRIISGNVGVYFSHWSLNNSHHWQLVVSNNGKQAALSRFVKGEVVAIAQSYKVIRDEYLDNKDFAKADTLEMGFSRSNGWNNKMFVRADEMPHHIRITDIKVERLQDISDEDCLKEGVCVRTERHPRQVFEPEYTFGEGGYHARYPVAAFGAMIYGIYSKDTWNSNPWCFCYEFELID